MKFQDQMDRAGIDSTELALLDGATAGAATAGDVVAIDSNRDVTNIRNLTLTTLAATTAGAATVNGTATNAGVSGTAGTISVFPTTASKGKTTLTATDNSGDTTTAIVTAAQAGARTLTVPDPGASASFAMTAGAQTFSGVQTLSASQLLTAATDTLGSVIQRIGATATEGLETFVYEETVSPAAVETNLIETPAGAVIRSVQANVETALTGGSTTVTFAVGTVSDPDKYGYPGSDTLAQNAKVDTIPTHAILGSAEQMVLTGAATGGTADGDTALTVGSVRVRVVYDVLNSLDDA